MDETPNQNPTPSAPLNNNASDADLTPGQVEKLTTDAVTKAKEFAMHGNKTRKEPEQGVTTVPGYDWWENQGTYESDNWSVSFWDFDNDTWQVQATKIELKSDGHSLMTSYSLREKNDPSFPGFQVYKEQSDERYKKGPVEDIVYLNRVFEGMIENLRKK